MSDNKIKIALIDARLNSGQVNLLQLVFFRLCIKYNLIYNIIILLKGKDGTQMGPKHLKTPYLYDNLRNLSKKHFIYMDKCINFLKSISSQDCEVINDAEVDDCIDHAEEIEYFNNKNIHTVGKTNLMVTLFGNLLKITTHFEKIFYFNKYKAFTLRYIRN
jgi:hypothetical protein